MGGRGQTHICVAHVYIYFFVLSLSLNKSAPDHKHSNTQYSQQEKKRKKKQAVSSRENLLGDIIRPFPGPIQFFMLGAINPMVSP